MYMLHSMHKNEGCVEEVYAKSGKKRYNKGETKKNVNANKNSLPCGAWVFFGDLEG